MILPSRNKMEIVDARVDLWCVKWNPVFATFHDLPELMSLISCIALFQRSSTSSSVSCGAVETSWFMVVYVNLEVVKCIRGNADWESFIGVCPWPKGRDNSKNVREPSWFLAQCFLTYSPMLCCDGCVRKHPTPYSKNSFNGEGFWLAGRCCFWQLGRQTFPSSGTTASIYDY